jgi:hypothetical protein
MAVLGAPSGGSRWAQDPEALLIFTLEVARDDPRLFDEVLDWLIRSESIVSTRRLRNLSEGPEDERLVSATLMWLSRQRRRSHSTSWTPAEPPPDLEPLFRGLSASVRNPDPAFLAHGLLRPEARPPEIAGARPHKPDQLRVSSPSPAGSGRTRGGRAFPSHRRRTGGHGRGGHVVCRLRQAQRSGSVGFAARRWRGFAGHDRIGPAIRCARARWAHLLRLDVGDLPLHRDWPQLLSALRTTLRWLDRPELARSSEYLRASQARDLLEEIRPRLSHAGRHHVVAGR